jgi:cell division ATPase FtsA
MKDIDKYVCSQMELAVRVGVPINISGVNEDVAKPEYATAIGLMYADYEAAMTNGHMSASKKSEKKKSKAGGESVISKVLKLFK